METNSSPSKEKDFLKQKDQFLNLLEKDPNNSVSFLKLILDEFISSAGTLAKKKLLQSLFCNDSFKVEFTIYYQLANLFQQEIDMDNVNHILQEEKDKNEIIKNINFLEKDIGILKDQKEIIRLEILSLLRDRLSQTS